MTLADCRGSARAPARAGRAPWPGRARCDLPSSSRRLTRSPVSMMRHRDQVGVNPERSRPAAGPGNVSAVRPGAGGRATRSSGHLSPRIELDLAAQGRGDDAVVAQMRATASRSLAGRNRRQRGGPCHGFGGPRSRPAEMTEGSRRRRLGPPGVLAGEHLVQVVGDGRDQRSLCRTSAVSQLEVDRVIVGADSRRRTGS